VDFREVPSQVVDARHSSINTHLRKRLVEAFVPIELTRCSLGNKNPSVLPVVIAVLIFGFDASLLR
jgi:hypothetical protein